MPRTDAFGRAIAVASANHGVISHGQALSSGLSAHQVRGLLDREVWLRRVRGVYVVGGSPDTVRQRLAVALAATQAARGVVSHVSAAALWGCGEFPPLPHITVPRAATAGRGTAKVHRSDLPPVDRARREGFPVTSLSRTIVDCAAVLDRPSLEAIIDVAFCRRMATRDSVQRAADRAGRGRRGLELVRSATAVWSPTIEPGSPAEVRALRVLRELGLTGIEPQVEIRDSLGCFLARIDLGDPVRRRGFEYDGVEAHNPRFWRRDEPRYARLAAEGWEIESLSKLDLLPGEARLRRIVERWLLDVTA